MAFYEVSIARRVQPSLVLAVESEELKLAAGLQDRVIQVYEGVMFMDFSRQRMVEIDGYNCGEYTRVESPLPPLYMAYSTDFSEPTEVVHNNLREMFDRGDTAVVEAMGELADLTQRAHAAIISWDVDALGGLINDNFDLRKSIMHLPQEHLAMVATARATGASAKFAGSGGAILGTYKDQAMFDRLRESLAKMGCRVIKPIVDPR